MYKVIAADIGGTHFRVALFDQEGRRLALTEGETRHDPSSGGRDWMLQQLRECLAVFSRRADSPLKAWGISFGGPVDFERQRVTSIHLPGWKSFALAQWVQEVLGIPCRLDNDANAGALGEYCFGAGRATQSLMYVTISTGIGGGIVCKGEVFRGKDSLAGEIGHMRLTDAEVVCSCGGKGCLEALASGTAIGLKARQTALRHPQSTARILELSGGRSENITAKAVFQAAAEGDPTAMSIVRAAARWLAKALLIVIRILNPDKIIVGGGVAQAGDLLLGQVREFLNDSCSIGYSTEIVLAELGTYSPLYGAAAIAMRLASSIES